MTDISRRSRLFELAGVPETDQPTAEQLGVTFNGTTGQVWRLFSRDWDPGRSRVVSVNGSDSRETELRKAFTRVILPGETELPEQLAEEFRLLWHDEMIGELFPDAKPHRLIVDTGQACVGLTLVTQHAEGETSHANLGDYLCLDAADTHIRAQMLNIN